MTLQEIYSDEDLEMRQFDLYKIAEMINYWLDDGEVDPDMAHYAGMALMSLANCAPELPDEQ